MLYSLNTRLKKLMPDEIKCQINRLGDIFDLIKENPDIRCNIQYTNMGELSEKKLDEQIDFIKEVAKDYTIAVINFQDLRKLKAKGYNVYLDLPVSDWETFNNLKNIGVSDIYIDGALGFQMEKIGKAKGKIKIRVTPHMSPNAQWSSSDNENSFYIRPEDIDNYSKYVDILDFRDNSKDAEETLFNIYKRKIFPFDLNNLIRQLNLPTNNIYIANSFCSNRLNCGQRCQEPDISCHLCRNAILISNKMNEYISLTEKN